VTPRYECLDGNEAAARIAYALSEVIAIYPITPASPMAEHCDDWSAAGRANLWGAVPDVVEMQSEAGAAGALHGALQKGALATTFTASQGLLLMIPNMFKIAGELTPAVIHVAARTIATHALSIFGDHSDVMHARSTGWAMLAAGSVQEAHDFALISHVATLRSRVPFLHFFDGFRTSHEIDKIAVLEPADIAALVDDADVLAFRRRGLTPEAPVVRGTAQNPDVFFQAREACNPYHAAVPGIVQATMDALAAQTGRQYHLADYHGAPDAERVLIVMGSAAGAVEETVDALVEAGEKVGMLRLRLFQPFPAAQILAALPATTRTIGVLDRTKEPGAVGEPLYLEVVAALAEAMDRDEPPFASAPRVVGGRYGLSSKELTPSMIKPVFQELASPRPKRHFTVGIIDDVTHLSLPIDGTFRHPRPAGEVQALFYGLGSDGTVGANKASVKIIGEGTDLFSQGYFVYDSKKSGSVTVSHLRFGPEPIRSTYLVEEADFIACHQFGLLGKNPILDHARPGATFLLNAPYGPDEVWPHLPGAVQRQIIDKGIDLWVIDAYAVADAAGMGNRINTVMQPCFFQLSGVLPPEEAIARIKEVVARTYAKRGDAVVERNFAAIDMSLAKLARVTPGAITNDRGTTQALAASAPDLVARVTARIMAGEGDLLPVSALPVDGTFPTGTTRYEKRQIAQMIPIWDPSICIDCGKCAMVCPHAAIRMKVFPTAAVEDAPPAFQHKEFRSRDLPDHRLTIQVAPDDCTGCGVCVDVCPARDKSELRHKAIDMAPIGEHLATERANWDVFTSIAPLDRSLIPHDTVKGSQVLEPLFEFSGACGGCGETPYLRLVSQLFGDRMIVANATGCSSIYGANLPTTPWTVDAAGRGPAWANSLFEDNAEFGLGMRLALDTQAEHARALLARLAPAVGEDLAATILGATQDTEPEVQAQRARVARLRTALASIDGPQRSDAQHLLTLTGDLVQQGIWIIGGDGWAYDIGFGGLDHVLSSGRDINVLVLDTEVYSNTGGQASKATPRGAVAKFSAAGKRTAKKDLGAIARAYGNVFVAQIAMGANDAQTTKALLEAAAWPGPSLVIAYSTCIAHGIDMSTSMAHQKDAVKSGYWPLYRFHPSEADGGHPFKLDSSAPTIPIADFVAAETRFAVLKRTDPDRAAALADLAQADADERWRYYQQLAGIQRTVPHRHLAVVDPAPEPGGPPA
jgi:pyruvate-ferredoxin/flavodoxin oxidoreductase